MRERGGRTRRDGTSFKLTQLVPFARNLDVHLMLDDSSDIMRTERKFGEVKPYWIEPREQSQPACRTRRE